MELEWRQQQFIPSWYFQKHIKNIWFDSKDSNERKDGAINQNPNIWKEEEGMCQLELNSG